VHARSNDRSRRPRGRLRRTAASAALLLGLAALAAPAGPAQAATGQGTVYVLQGIADVSASVSVDGRTVSRDVAARTVVGPLRLDTGRHLVRLEASGVPAVEASFTVGAGTSTDLVAHRFPDADRSPAFTVFRNDLSAVPPGKTRLVVAHTAVVPPADIVVDGSPLVRNVANGESATRVVPARSYEVSIVPTATTGPAVLGPTTLTLPPGTLTNVFAIGDPSAGTMDAIVQSLPVRTSGSAAPDTVNTGDGGQAAAAAGRDDTGVAVGVLGLLSAAATVGLLARRRARVR
jgi:hypothetical protein